MAKQKRPVPWRPNETFIASKAEVDPLLVRGGGLGGPDDAAMPRAGRRGAGLGELRRGRPGRPAKPVPLPLGALVPPEDVRLLHRLWAERPERRCGGSPRSTRRSGRTVRVPCWRSWRGAPDVPAPKGMVEENEPVPTLIARLCPLTTFGLIGE